MTALDAATTTTTPLRAASTHSWNHSSPQLTTRSAAHPAVTRALRLQAAAPVRSLLVGAAFRATGGDPVAPEARTAFTEALGAHDVGRRLARLAPTGQHTDQGTWRVLTAVPAVPGGHLVIGPAGVVVVTTAHEPGSRVAASGSRFTVDGQRLPLLRTARDEARRVQELLSAAVGRPVPVGAVVAVVGAERLTLARRPGAVAVVAAPRLVRWLRHRPAVLDAAEVTAVAAAAADPRSWSADEEPPTSGDDAAAFELLLRRVRVADRVRQAWVTAAAVVGSASVVVGLLDLLG